MNAEGQVGRHLFQQFEFSRVEGWRVIRIQLQNANCLAAHLQRQRTYREALWQWIVRGRPGVARQTLHNLCHSRPDCERCRPLTILARVGFDPLVEIALLTGDGGREKALLIVISQQTHPGDSVASLANGDLGHLVK